MSHLILYGSLCCGSFRGENFHWIIYVFHKITSSYGNYFSVIRCTPLPFNVFSAGFSNAKIDTLATQAVHSLAHCIQFIYEYTRTKQVNLIVYWNNFRCVYCFSGMRAAWLKYQFPSRCYAPPFTPSTTWNFKTIWWLWKLFFNLLKVLLAHDFQRIINYYDFVVFSSSTH